MSDNPLNLLKEELENDDVINILYNIIICPKYPTSFRFK